MTSVPFASASPAAPLPAPPAVPGPRNASERVDEPELRQALWPLFLGRIVAATGFSITFPFFSLYLHTERGLPMTAVGMILMAAGFAGSLGELAGGEMADRIGRKRTMTAALALRGFSVFVLATGVAAGWPMPWILAVHVAGSFVGHFYEPASQAFVADTIGPARRVSAFAWIRTGGNIGWALGPMIAGLILGHSERSADAYPLMFFITAGTCFVTAGIVAAWVREPARRIRLDSLSRLEGIAEVLRNRPFLGLCLASICVYTVMAQLSATLMVYCTTALGIPTASCGWFFSLNGVLVVLLQMPVSRMILKHRISTAIILGAICYTVGYGSLGFAHRFPPDLAIVFVAICMSVVTTGEVMLTPSTITLAANLAPPDRRGRYQGIFGWCSILGWCFGPLLGGVALDLFHEAPEKIWGVVAALGTVGTLGYVRLRSSLRPEIDRPYLTS